MTEFVKDTATFNEVIENNSKVLVDFFAEWCGPCKRISPLVNKLAITVDGLKVCKVDVEQLPEICSKYKITSMPTFIFFKNGVAVKVIKGADKELLETTAKSF